MDPRRREHRIGADAQKVDVRIGAEELLLQHTAQSDLTGRVVSLTMVVESDISPTADADLYLLGRVVYGIGKASAEVTFDLRQGMSLTLPTNSVAVSAKYRAVDDDGTSIGLVGSLVRCGVAANWGTRGTSALAPTRSFRYSAVTGTDLVRTGLVPAFGQTLAALSDVFGNAFTIGFGTSLGANNLSLTIGVAAGVELKVPPTARCWSISVGAACDLTAVFTLGGL